MSLEPGARLGPYEIINSLGVGGMGEVYRARDTKLGRDVAIKVLPEEFAQDEDRLARFSREAQVLASLNHPNIASIYGLEESEGTRAIVLELVEGPTLADRTRESAISLEDALDMARQTAEALEVAHEKGVIHRDLKPDNIKITEDGTVKVLDFGLAKALVDERPSDEISESPTLGASATRAGMILGTAAYMSPEQARGSKVDRRSDIWSFGVVIYEMLSGRKLFDGESASDKMAAVLRADVSLDDLPSATPDSVRNLMRRCLTRDPKRRLQSMGEARIAIEDCISRGSESPKHPQASATVPPARRKTVPWALAVVLAVTAGALGWILARSSSPDPHESLRFSIVLPPNERLDDDKTEGVTLALSPDGERLVYAAVRRGVSRLYLRDLDSFETVLMPGTEDGHSPFFSPDGSWIGFFAEGKLKKISVDGSSQTVLAKAEWGHGSWGPDDRIVYTPSYASGLWSVSANGGEPQELTQVDRSEDVLGHWWPQVLPGGKSVLYSDATTPAIKTRIAVLSLATGERKSFAEGAFARYVPSGHIVFVRSGKLMAVPFDLDRLEMTGTPVAVLDDVPLHVSHGSSQFTFSDEGTLAYVPASFLKGGRVLEWVDRTGASEPVTDVRRAYAVPRLSPDGQIVAVTISDESEDVWIHDLVRGSQSRLTVEPTGEIHPVWTVDGRKVIYASDRPIFHLYSKPVDGSAPEEPLLNSPHDKRPSSVGPDGTVAYVETPPHTRNDIWVIPRGGEPRAILASEFTEGSPSFSPDGHWLAYESDESGRLEVYVQAFPGPGGKQQISTNGGTEPLWSRDGRELFYRNGDELLAVSVSLSGSGLKASHPKLLFERPYDHARYRAAYDVTRDGSRFLFVRTPPETAARQIYVVLNWFDELQRKFDSP